MAMPASISARRLRMRLILHRYKQKNQYSKRTKSATQCRASLPDLDQPAQIDLTGETPGHAAHPRPMLYPQGIAGRTC
jgi:hypothetical protein